ncbi:GumC family protein [Pseudomonas sp. BMS12]|uniref:GumC family protein n=1 Tax=Pseudomonas sp. BMS12 TaxID=1796033 RepID=UPI00083B2647|nr:lipopolysaccharide biosynthesis protein [Pseudomonas sp. BMS12]
MIDIRSFRDLLRLFFIFRREFQWAVIATVVVAVLGAFLLPTKYESNARLLVKPGRESTTLPIEVANRQALIAPSTQRDPIVDEEKMLTGRPIVRMVAERYIEQMAGYQPQGFWKTIKFYVGKVFNWGIELLRSILQMLGIVEAQSDVERLAKKLEKNFTVGHEPGSAVMEVSFTWNDPAIAQKVVETWVDAFLEERTRTLGRKSLYAFYENEMQKVDSQIGLLKTELQGRLQGIQSVSVKERLENLTNQINRLADARAEKLNDQAGIRSFLTNARLQLKRQPQEVITAREVSLNPSQLDLKRRLNALEQERANLLRTFLPDAPPVREAEENIAQMKAMIAREAERLERSKNFAPNSIVVSLRQQIVDAELRDRQLAGELKDYDLQLEQLRSERSRVMSEEPDINRLLLQLSSAEKSYALYAENLEKARIDRELDKSQISNIALVEQATYNPSRVFPKSLMILLLAIPAGLAVGLLTLYICYLLDQRIHDGARIEETFKVPLWTTLSDLGAQPWRIGSPFTASLYRLYSLLPTDDIESKGLTLALTSARVGEGVSFVTEHLQAMLQDRGHSVRLEGDTPAQPGEVLLLDAAGLMNNQQAFIALRRADLIALVIEAKTSTVPVVENALSVLHTAFGKVDGIILNRRRFEVPARVLDLIRRVRGEG